MQLAYTIEVYADDEWSCPVGTDRNDAPSATNTATITVLKVDIDSKYVYICPQGMFTMKDDSEPPGTQLTWSIENDTSGGASVDANGNVTAGPNPCSFTVKAVATASAACSDTHQVTVLEPAQTAPGQRVHRWICQVLTDAEWALVQAHPIVALQVNAAKQEAEQTAVQLFGNVPDGTAANAFLHAYWNYLMVKSIGATLAKQFADAHENIQGNPCADTTTGASKMMDLNNNKIGRDLATTPPYSAYTKDQIKDLLEQKADNGELQG